MNIQLAKLLKYSKWYTTDKDNTAGLELDSITTTSSHGQMITKPTHFINESSSCINLNFSSNNCFVKNCGSELSNYDKYHYNIIYKTFNFDVPLLQSYYRDVWDYKRANTESIQKAISMFDWSKAFRHLHTNGKCELLTNISLHIKPKNVGYKTSDWMNRLIILSLKKTKTNHEILC